MTTHGQEKSKVDAIAKFGKRQLTSLDELAFSDLLSQASECMGLPCAGEERDSDMDSFSHDILKFELSGPDYENFSVVDLPGLFRKPTPGQTSKEDMTLVREMIARYLSNPRSIILAVVPANVDIATQEIIQMAEDADPDGQRTLGVFTKPDLVDRGAEEKIIELVTNHTGRARFNLGYTVVCNRSQSDMGMTNTERNTRESAFFKTKPWSAIPEERAGVKALKGRLDKLLVDVTRQNFHAVGFDVRAKIRKLEVELDGLGPSRQTSNDQRNHLIRIATDFREITAKAIDAYYGRDDCFKDDSFRLATNVMAMNNAFSEIIARNGFTRRFRRNPSSSVTNIGAEEVEVAEQEAISSSADTLKTTSSSNSGKYELLREYPELRVLTGQLKPEPKKEQGDIMQWITKMNDRSKGFGIGTLNPSLLPSLFHEQSRSWGFYANGHAEDVIQTIHRFNYKALCYCCRDSVLSERLWARLSQLLLPLYKKALDQVAFLITTEQHGNLMTMNHYFADNLRKAREDRIKQRLLSLNSWTTDDAQKEPLLRLTDTIAALVSNDEQSTQDLHDTLKSYYKVARKRFVDAVCVQAIVHFLVSSKEGPLWLFSPQFIGGISDVDLNLIAGEADEAVKYRLRLVHEITNLRAGQRILDG
ncbi:hypothetical protein ACLOAV_004632 [Pseudogymnoascus australis]